MVVEGRVSLVEQDIVNKSVDASSAEQLAAPLVWFRLNVLPQGTCSRALVGDHHFIYGLRRSLLDLQELSGYCSEEGMDLEEPVGGASDVLIVIEVQEGPDELEPLRGH